MKNATFYVQLTPKWSYWDKDKLESISMARATQKKPDKPVPGAVTIKLTVKVSESVFEPFTPTVEIVIPEKMVDQNIEVMVEDPSAETE